MRRTCLCGAPTIVAREIDSAIRVLDAEPVDDLDSVVLFGDLNDEPTAVWGVAAEGETLPWGAVATADAFRYRKHECPKGA